MSLSPLDDTMSTTAAAAQVPVNVLHQTQLLDEQELICRLKYQSEMNGTGPLDGDCRPIWDGILCWGRTAAGHLVTQACPSHVLGSNKHEVASKFCTETGYWFSRDGSNASWTNFTLCFPKSAATVIVNVTSSSGNDSYIEQYLSTIKTIAEVGYALSLISLLVAFFILASIKKLRCPRNVLHMHLFASFIMRAFMTLLKDSIFKSGLGMSVDVVSRDDGEYFNSEHQVNWPCRTIISLWQYFIMANYSWILMEGLYLHNLIFLALFTDSSSITMYIGLGWGLPAIFVIPWVICRALLDNIFCWTTHDNRIVFLLIRVPTAVSIVINFLLFMNIIRVLLLKLKSSVSEETKTYRRWAKSTLVLVPLFGVHYMMFIGLQLSDSHAVEIVWLFCDQLFASFNGFFVALLYCFLNGEVRAELSRKWSHFSLPELLQSCPFARHDHMANGILSGGGGGGRAGRFFGLGRQAHPRGSCYSSTSFTTVSVLPAGHCCNVKKQRPPPFTAEPPPHRPSLPVADDAAKVPLNGRMQQPEATDCQDKLSAEAKEITSNMGQDRRWSVSDYDIHNNGMELRSITAPKSFSVKL